MPTTTSRHAIEQALVDLCWSLWTELGVAGVSRRHQSWYVDPEALIILTASLRDSDPRLRDEATDWCIRYARMIATVRLKTLLAEANTETVAAFEAFAATVGDHVRTNWPSAGTPRPFRPTGRSRLENLARPALFGLRLRAMFGTGARAEIIRVLVSNPDHDYSAAELSDEAAFTKRAIELEIEGLRMAGLIIRTELRGRHRIRLARTESPIEFTGSIPQWWPRWVPILRTFLGGLHLVQRFEMSSPIVRGVEARKYLRETRQDIDRARLAHPETATDAGGHWDEVERWLRSLTSAFASGDANAFVRIRH